MKEKIKMRKTILIICIAVICALAAFAIYATPVNRMSPQESAKAKCKRGCREKQEACKSNAQAADSANTRARLNSCAEEYMACEQACDN
jgi:ABC-type Na+ efflux pump permease subunit